MNTDLTLIAWDTETFKIGIDTVEPPMICSTMHDLSSKDSDIYHRLDKTSHVEALSYIFDDTNVIGHNIGGFDLGVAANYDESLRPKIWKALREGRVHCTMIREMLLSLATAGHMDSRCVAGKHINYSLADLLFKYTGEDITEEKEDESSPRSNYSVVADVPLEEWPDEFISYAISDAEHTAKIFLEQELVRQRLMEERGFDPLAVEGFRVLIHFALSQMTAIGNELDPKEVLRVTKEFTEMYNDPRLVDPLVEAGIVRPAVAPIPNASGTQIHVEGCPGNKGHEDFKQWTKDRTALRKKAKEEGLEPADVKMLSPCKCPYKMKAAKKESENKKRLHEYVWDLARNDEGMEAWASDGLVNDLKEAGIKDEILTKMCTIDQEKVREYMMNCGGVTSEAASGIPEGWKLKVDKDWMANYAGLDEILSLYAERKKIEKIVTSYIPSLYWAEGYQQCPRLMPGETNRIAGKQPATRVRAGFSPLKETGRCSSRAATRGRGNKAEVLYPSFNGQQADPRIRGCVVAEGYLGCGEEYPDLSTYDGRVLFSLDYDGMELGTLAQTCINIPEIGFSRMAELINDGVNLHTYLGAQIATYVFPEFASLNATSDQMQIYENFLELKKFDETCDLPGFAEAWAEFNRNNPKGVPPATWGGFFLLNRTFAKPTDLGLPGGLGIPTFRTYAKGTYGLNISQELGETLNDVWRKTFPEMPEYLNYASKKSFDPWTPHDVVEDDNGKMKKVKWRGYMTPKGMWRAHCTYTQWANGNGLQSPSAEGALGATAEIVEASQLSPELNNVFPTIMIHDEVFGSMKWEGIKTLQKVKFMDEIMVRRMREVTPDVKAATEPALMFRWSKKADPVYRTVGGERLLVPWAPGIESAWKEGDEQPKEMK